MSSSSPTTVASNYTFLVALARAAGGAILFSLPMFMTMEMWWLGFSMRPLRMGLLVTLFIPLLCGLAYYSGFERRVSLLGSAVDAFVGYAVGFVCAVGVLAAMRIIHLEMSLNELIGKVTVQSIPGGLGAVLAASLLGLSEEKVGPEEEEPSEGGRQLGILKGYFRELFLMIAGGLFLAFNVAPTEEMVVIAYTMTAWHAVVLMLVTIVGMHAFVYVIRFQGQETKPEEHSWWSVFLRYTLVGYALALLVGLYCLWTFGRTDGMGLSQTLMMAVVLGFPTALGAAAARLIL